MGTSIFNALAFDKDVWVQTRQYLIDKLLNGENDQVKQRNAICIAHFVPNSVDTIINELQQKAEESGNADGMLFFYKQITPFHDSKLSPQNYEYMVRYLLRRTHNPLAEQLLKSYIDDDVVSNCFVELAKETVELRSENKQLKQELKEIKSMLTQLLQEMKFEK